MESIEIWKQVTESPFNQRYEVSSLGRVREIQTGRDIARTLNPVSGYRYSWLYINGAGKNRPVHRLVALAFLGAPPEGKNDVNHKDCNRENNRLENLEWASRSENMQHAKNLGRIPTGEKHHCYGKQNTPEQKAKISATLKETWKRRGGGPTKGTNWSPQQRARMEEYWKNHTHPRKGLSLTEEHKARMSTTLKETWSQPGFVEAYKEKLRKARGNG